MQWADNRKACLLIAVTTNHNSMSATFNLNLISTILTKFGEYLIFNEVLTPFLCISFIDYNCCFSGNFIFSAFLFLSFFRSFFLLRWQISSEKYGKLSKCLASLNKHTCFRDKSANRTRIKKLVCLLYGVAAPQTLAWCNILHFLLWSHAAGAHYFFVFITL